MVKKGYEAAGFTDADVRPFILDMANQFAQADVLICRSGATTAAEVAAAGKAAIFIPFPFAADDHQRKNAEAFERVLHLVGTPSEIDKMEAASRKLGRADAAQKAVDLALSVASSR
jgi:UDP-N-acetylglucosamine--N-acetylmuramyl-(pentapeptide) pyrophosphoryl-undecaprenol N-acetylglucosamine transferase